MEPLLTGHTLLAYSNEPKVKDLVKIMRQTQQAYILGMYGLKSMHVLVKSKFFLKFQAIAIVVLLVLAGVIASSLQRYCYICKILTLFHAVNF